ncbi:DUF2059 domain-containing protein [Piscinibacter defluvii]|uniref:DUF2059 domain-containing protein n=1 Tax=Piscinibacter defluvii TaxID=1796922 RepID=UPI0013E3666A|nr:DUF2059 domain-containing protein [Piscinibacter defluvii]
MKRPISSSILVASLLVALNARAQPPSQTSIEELLSLVNAESMLEAMYANIEGAMRQGMVQGLGGRPLTLSQEEIFNSVPRKFTDLMREEVGWQKIKPDIVLVYSETFEQEEIDGLIAFYRSPVGKAFVAKTPIVMQKSMALTQTRMQSLLPRMQATMEKAVADIKAAR